MSDAPAPETVLAPAPIVPVEAAAFWIPLSEVVPWIDNPRENDESVLPVARSIARFGYGRPFVGWDPDRGSMLVVGHTARKATLLLLDRPPVFEFQVKPPEEGALAVCPGCARDVGEVHAPKCPTAEIPGVPARGKIPIRWRPDWTEEEARGYAIADNKTGEIATWKGDVLADQLIDLATYNLTPDILGWPTASLADALATLTDDLPETTPPEADTPSDEAPEVNEATVYSRPGEVYLLGPHRVMCGDSLDPKAIAHLCNGLRPVIWHADPPYGMGKEDEGVANDNLTRDKLDAFLWSAWQASRPCLADNATAYMWGNAEDLWRAWYARFAPSETFTLRNEVVWDKGSSGAGGMSLIGAEGLRCYPPATERCLVWMLGQQSFGNVNAEDYWEGWEPLRSYLAGEAERMGWGPRDIKRICGVWMFSHWFSKSQWVMIPEPHYEALQAAAEGQAFLTPYVTLRTQHAEADAEFTLRREAFYASRPYFDNTHDNMTDVWQFNRVAGEERHGHATPKPVAMMERVARTSAPEGGILLEPFGGSGSTLMGCAASGRVCLTMELLPQWVDVIRRRYTTWATENGLDPGPGALGPA